MRKTFGSFFKTVIENLNANVKKIEDRATEILDIWAKNSSERSLKTIRLISIIVGIITIFTLIADYIYMFSATMNGDTFPTLHWVFWHELIPWILLVLPSYYGWYFSDLGLIRNHK